MEYIMKKLAGLALGAALIAPLSSVACEITDTILFTGNGPSGISAGAQLVGVLNYDSALITEIGLLADGQIIPGGRVGTVDGIEYFADYVEFTAGTTHTVETVFTLQDGSVDQCGATFTVPVNNAPPVIIHDYMEHYDDIVETENGVLVTVFAEVIDTDENVADANIIYELVEAPTGVATPAIEITNGNNQYVDFQEIEFTTPGDYSLRVKATDAYGEAAYSKPIEFTISGCKTSTIADHVTAGRAMNISGSYFTTGAYVYLGYNNSANVVALEKIEALGNWWVVCL